MSQFQYANWSSVGASPWEVTFVFQRLGIPASTLLLGNETVNASPLERTEISMVPGLAKLFAASALSTMCQYEKERGPIKLPPDEQKRYDELITTIKSALID